jgi:hypothetical protein
MVIAPLFFALLLATNTHAAGRRRLVGADDDDVSGNQLNGDDDGPGEHTNTDDDNLKPELPHSRDGAKATVTHNGETGYSVHPTPTPTSCPTSVPTFIPTVPPTLVPTNLPSKSPSFSWQKGVKGSTFRKPKGVPQWLYLTDVPTAQPTTTTERRDETNMLSEVYSSRARAANKPNPEWLEHFSGSDLGLQFKTYDINHDGMITSAELRHTLELMHVGSTKRVDGVLKVVLKKYDYDGDGNISYQEFIHPNRKHLMPTAQPTKVPTDERINGKVWLFGNEGAPPTQMPTPPSPSPTTAPTTPTAVPTTTLAPTTAFPTAVPTIAPTGIWFLEDAQHAAAKQIPRFLPHLKLAPHPAKWYMKDHTIPNKDIATECCRCTDGSWKPPHVSKVLRLLGCPQKCFLTISIGALKCTGADGHGGPPTNVKKTKSRLRR